MFQLFSSPALFQAKFRETHVLQEKATSTLSFVHDNTQHAAPEHKPAALALDTPSSPQSGDNSGLIQNPQRQQINTLSHQIISIVPYMQLHKQNVCCILRSVILEYNSCLGISAK